MVLCIYASVTRVFFSCVFAVSVSEAIVNIQTSHVLLVHSVPTLCKPACVNAGTVCLYTCLIACTNKLT